MINTIRLLLLPLVLVAVVACSTQNTTPGQADNTARNASNPPTQTPGDQAENQADLQISANIRKEILADDSLSSNAHNVKIITSGGIVTLRGPVKNQQEKATVEAKAKQVPGVTKVDSFLEVE